MVKKPAIFFDRDGTLIKTSVRNNKPFAINNIDKLDIYKASYKVTNLLKKKI